MIFHCGILIIIMFNIHGPCDIIDHIHPIQDLTMKEKKNADKSPNIIIIYLPGRRQISKIGKILQKKEKERESAY